MSISSCTDSVMDDLTATESFALNGLGVSVPVSSLPAPITGYVSTNYAGQTITKAEKYANGYEVTLSGGTKLEFNLAGAFLEVSGSSKNNTTSTSSTVASSTLPASITSYINTNYAGQTIVKAEKSLSKYEVTLSGGTKLEFSLAGAFLEVSGSSKTTSSSASTGMPVNSSGLSLPSNITSFISTNYPGQSITKAEKSSSKYEITLSSGVKLEFDLNGNFKEVSGGGKKKKNG